MLAARRFGKPFAIVPCCVFPTEFPERRLPNGEPVVSFSQLCEYLPTLAGTDLSTNYLPYLGRNRVLFRLQGSRPEEEHRERMPDMR